MRVTQLSIFNMLKHRLSENRQALAEYQQRFISGKRVTKASDDSVAYTISRHLKNALRRNGQYQSNITSGLAKARAAEDALQGMLDVLNNFKTIALSGATDTKSAQDRDLLADQIKALKKKMVGLANTKFNGVYLFAGTNTGESPFSLDESSGLVNDSSNGDPLKVQISDLSNVTVTVSGDDLRNIGNGNDLFEVMQTVENALKNNKPSIIHDSLDEISAAYNHVTSLTAKLGSHINRMKFVDNRIAGQEINQKNRVSDLVDASYANVILNIQNYEKTYQAALAIHARIIQTSLLNYL